MEEVKDTIFVGGIPYDMTLEEFEDEVAAWGPVTKKYLKYHGGWGTVSFESNSSRNRFLKDKTKHKLGSKLVDVKPYIFNPDKVKNSGTSHLVIGKGQVKLTSENAMKKVEEAKNMSIIEKQMSDLQANNQIEAQTGAIVKYFGESDGLIKTSKHGEIAFNLETVYLCKLHRLTCRDSQCTNYLPLKKWNIHDMAAMLPVGTQVSFYSRSVVFKDIPEFKNQATLVWPQASKKPSLPILQTADDLNQVMIRFASEVVNLKSRQNMSSAWITSSPTPSSSSSNSLRSGPPGFATGTLGGFAHSLINSDKPKFDYDVPLESLLDDGGDGIDNEAEILMWIKDFLQNELGKLGGNVPMRLMNNIRSLGSDEMVLQEIVSYGKSKGIPIDNAKRDSISNGLKRLRSKIRGREETASFLPKDSQFHHASLKNFTDFDLDFIYDMPLNHEYLSLLEIFYAKFLKSENLEFRMDFDQAFLKLSPFMAFKSFNWILDWMTNDRRKKLRQHSDLKYFNDSEEILGAVAQFWNNLKRLRAKTLFSIFLKEDQDKTQKMLICYMKHHILDIERMNCIIKVLKEINPAELKSTEYLTYSPIKIEFDGKIIEEFELQNMKKYFERFLNWIDTQNLNFVPDPQNSKFHDLDFQKFALIHPWYSQSKNCVNLEDELLSIAGNSFKSLIEKWKNCILDYQGINIDPGSVLKFTLDYFADKLDFSQTCLEFAWSICESQGFVAHHYSDSIGIILTVKGEVVIFEKSAVVNHNQDLEIGSYVRLRIVNKVAEKVWPVQDFKTSCEPLKSAASLNYIRAEKYYKSMAQNLSEVGLKLPALKSVVGPKALLKDLYFTLKTFSYMPNMYKRNSYDPYLESKESLNGDHSEAVDILASQDIGLNQLTDVYMASKLLGFEGHEKLIDILATLKVGVPDPLNFAADLTAFFEENCKKEVLVIKTKAKNDVKAVLNAAEALISRSALFLTQRPASAPSATGNGNGKQIENGNGNYYNDMSEYDNLKLEALEKNVSILNREIRKLASVEESEKQLKFDLANLKRDQDAKQATIRQQLKPIMDRLTELTRDLDYLKKDVKEMKGLKLAPGAPGAFSPSKKGSAIYVRVAQSHNRSEVHEFPTDENGNLSFTAVNAVYTGVNALKFESKETNSIRLCRKIGDIFEPPEDGWGDRLYIVHSNLSPASNPVPNLTASAFTGHHLFPGYLGPNPLSNPFSTGSMFK